MAIIVYKISDGSAVSYIPDTVTIAQAQASNQLADDDHLTSNGFAAIDGQPPLDPTHAWDTASKAVIVVVAPKAVLSLIVFWRRFTQAEREAVVGAYLTGTQAVKNKIGAFKDYLRDAGSVDLGDSYIQSCVQAMETAGVISAGRAAQILA